MVWMRAILNCCWRVLRKLVLRNEKEPTRTFICTPQDIKATRRNENTTQAEFAAKTGVSCSEV